MLKRLADSSQLSIVVQGPILHSAPVTTRQVCQSLRRHFPLAEIILSTWQGEDTAGLEANRVVFSPDPGSLPFQNTNLNRLLVSSQAGIQAASRRLVLKTRTDIVFHSDTVLDFWQRFPDYADADDADAGYDANTDDKDTDEGLRLFQHRVLIPSIYTKKPSCLSRHAFHPSDWCFLGLKTDLQTLFDVPLAGLTDLTTPMPLDNPRQLLIRHALGPRYSNEQYLWLSALRRRYPHLNPAHWLDLTPELLRQSECALANNFVVLDAGAQFGIFTPKYPQAETVFGRFDLYRHAEWRELYAHYCQPRKNESAAINPLPQEEDWIDGADWENNRHIAALRAGGRRWEAMLAECAAAMRDCSQTRPAAYIMGQWARLELEELARRERREANGDNGLAEISSTQADSELGGNQSQASPKAHFETLCQTRLKALELNTLCGLELEFARERLLETIITVKILRLEWCAQFGLRQDVVIASCYNAVLCELRARLDGLEAHWHQRALASLAQGDLDSAIATLQTLVAHASHHAEARNDLSVLLYRRGDCAGAREQARMAVALDPADPDARNNLAFLEAGLFNPTRC